MKKIIALIAALALCLSLCPAFADGALTQVAQLDDAYWIYNSDLLRVESRSGCAIAKADGNFDASEQKAVEQICAALDLDSKSFA